MSYTNITYLNEIIGNNILFLDLETSGLIKTKSTLKPEEKYHDYKSIEYDEARIISFGYAFINNFNYSYINEYIEKNIFEFIVKPDNFKINNNHIHGITQEYAENKGKSIIEYLKYFEEMIMNIEFIIGYNIYFDINILLSELYRYGFNNSIDKIIELKNNKKILCTGLLSSNYLKPDNWVKKFNYHIPKQIEVYKKCFNEYPNYPHNAKYDVIALIQINHYIYNNIYLKRQNVGKRWTDEEYKILLDEIKNKVPIDKICDNHKRNIKGIIYAIQKISI